MIVEVVMGNSTLQLFFFLIPIRLCPLCPCTYNPIVHNLLHKYMGTNIYMLLLQFLFCHVSLKWHFPVHTTLSHLTQAFDLIIILIFLFLSKSESCDLLPTVQLFLFITSASYPP